MVITRLGSWHAHIQSLNHVYYINGLLCWNHIVFRLWPFYFYDITLLFFDVTKLFLHYGFLITIYVYDSGKYGYYDQKMYYACILNNLCVEHGSCYIDTVSKFSPWFSAETADDEQRNSFALCRVKRCHSTTEWKKRKIEEMAGYRCGGAKQRRNVTGFFEDIRKPIRILLNLMTLPDMITYECVCMCVLYVSLVFLYALGSSF